MQRLGTMRTTAEARKQLDRLMRAHLHGEIDTQTFRNLTYGFSIMLSYFKQENDDKSLVAVQNQDISKDPLLMALKQVMGSAGD